MAKLIAGIIIGIIMSVVVFMVVCCIWFEKHPIPRDKS